jgi:hypothetical protein
MIHVVRLRASSLDRAWDLARGMTLLGARRDAGERARAAEGLPFSARG